MGVELGKQALDVGIVVRDAERMLAFYRDVLGFAVMDPLVFPGAATIHRVVIGDSILRLVDTAKTLPPPSADDELFAASGLRYLTLAVRNLDETVDACRAFGVNVPRPPTEIRPGVRATRLQDPDGNWIEMQSS